MSNYDNTPYIKIDGYKKDVYHGYENIIKKIKKSLNNKKVIVVDCYLGIDDSELLSVLINNLKPKHVFLSEEIFYDGDKLSEMMHSNLTEDSVRGVMYYGTIMDYVDKTKLSQMQEELIVNQDELLLIYGFGASLVSKGDLLIYADLTRWEIQLRYRSGLANFKQNNYTDDPLIKNKRGYFIEWRIADKHKCSIFDEIDLYLDTNIANTPKMVTGNAFRNALKSVCKQPFRLVPYFDPGVWGGQWMKEVCNLDKSKPNYAWSFDGVPEENSINLKFGDTIIATPALNVVMYQAKELLGAKNYARFGAEFPIRFDLLDTMGGGNLSLQVHPTTEYIKSHFGMPYTQDESYYILDSNGGGVYLGLKDNIDRDELINDLEKANEGGESFNTDKYINYFPANKHDHFLIPAGTIHCSSANCVVLEVSATPYIFTFKLWDWGRVGLDGKPRPIHIKDGKQVIDYQRTTSWVKENLVNAFTTIEETKTYTEIKTGLHELEFIETRVIAAKQKTIHHTNDGVIMMNLVEGNAAVINSPQNNFEPFTVHYAETFIIPAQVGEFEILPVNNEEIKVLKAYVRN